MNILALGAIGELVGGIAVVASLLYVGTQVRQNTAAVRANSAQGFADSINGVILKVAGGRAFRGPLARRNSGLHRETPPLIRPGPNHRRSIPAAC